MALRFPPHSWNGIFPGLTSVSPRDRPPVVPPFFAFRTMVGIGMLMILAGLTGDLVVVARPLVRGPMVSLARAACLVDRLRRGDLGLDRHRDRPAALGRLREFLEPPGRCSARFAANTVATSLVLFILVYGIVLAMGLYYINRLITRTGRSCSRAPQHRNAGAAIRARTQGLRRDRIINSRFRSTHQ